MSPFFRKTNQHIQESIIDEIQKHAIPVSDTDDLMPLFKRIGDSRLVLLGEASHGTHEYYTWRAEITKYLIQEKGFNFIGVEGDWPDCYKLNRYVKGYHDAGDSAFDVLQEFNRWPTWMWANWEIVALAEWLREWNRQLPLEQRVGFYGLDVYSLWESLEAILDYLQTTDPAAYETAKKAAACFEPFGFEGQRYGRSTALTPASCESEVVELLQKIQAQLPQYNTDEETVFSTEQNALVMLHAENYYRTMVRGGPESWNIRDRHMVKTLERLLDFHGNRSKAIVWEHNTHIGDARATDMSQHGMINVGELVTKKWKPEGVIKVGFGSHRGSVIAGRSWGDTMQEMDVPEGIPGSWEDLLHRAGEKDQLILLDKWKDKSLLKDPIDHRAIGVVYHPEYEARGNYVPSILPSRYEAFIHIDKSRALHPLHLQPDGKQMPETYPWGV